MSDKYIEELLNIKPFSLRLEEKKRLMLKAMNQAAEWHYNNNDRYKSWCKKHSFEPSKKDYNLSDIPFLPVQVFKKILLHSVPKKDIIRIVQSSATTTGEPSQIGFDKTTANRQRKAYANIHQDFLGGERKPYVIMDSESLGEQTSINARVAAIRGFLLGASKVDYVMFSKSEGQLELNNEKLGNLLKKYEEQKTKIVIFGFTFILYKHVALRLKRAGIRYNLKNSWIMHMGGWKKLQSESVSKENFNSLLSNTFGIEKSHISDIYGFVEQGIVYPDCPFGVKHTPVFSEIFIRDPDTLEVLPDGEEGLIHFVSPLPRSFPGISVITDDIGVIVGRGKCKCGRFGTQFLLRGRAKDVEVRGCGDILAEKIMEINDDDL